MPKKIPAHIIQERINNSGRHYIILDQSTYVNTHTKARFIDTEYGEWWATPDRVLQGREHPKRGRNCRVDKIKSSPQEVQDKINASGRDYIILDQATYINTYTKARFIDLEYGEWWTAPKNVLRGKNHPKRGRHNCSVTKTYSAQQVQERINGSGRTHITLDQTTYINLHTKARFFDSKYGEWWAKPYTVLYGSNHPQRGIQNTIDQKTYTPEEIQHKLDQDGRGIILDKSTYVNTTTRARFIDPEYGEWWTIPKSVLDGKGHPLRFFNKNKLELFVEQQLQIEWVGNKRQDSLKYKPDFQISGKIYLNVDGLYWHSELYKEKTYHFEIRKWFEDNGLRILQFRENEIRYKWDIVKGIIDAVSGKAQNKVGARSCELVNLEPNECYDFYEKWHLKGGIKIGGYGLKYKGELIAAISVKKVKDVLKIERFCVKAGWVVGGGYSKLLSRALSDYENIRSIQSWVDLRYGDGHSLERMGFVRVKDTLGWEWTDFVDTYNRLRCRANMDERGLSEKEHAEELGWVRIYDAGQRLFEKVVDKVIDLRYNTIKPSQRGAIG